MSSLTKTYYTPEQYLALEREAEYRSEYINGQIYPMNGQPYAMSGASEEHNLIVVNVLREVSVQFKGRPCKVYVTDMRVKVSPTGMYTYPDIVAVCNKPHFEDERVDTLLNPTVIIEVLSPSTEAYDRGDKFAHYRKLASLTDYVLVSQNTARVEHYVRHSEGSGQWVLTEISGSDGVLRLISIGCEVALKDVYDKVNLQEGGPGH
ncbi:MAG TPA: Uma2 family endonuclease [Chloroflexia bacterium]|jgi:Uma2 family endonuclease